MPIYILSFAAGFVTAKIVTKQSIKTLQTATLKNYIRIKDKFSGSREPKETI